MINPSSIMQIPPDVLFHELSGEAVLLNLASGKYYGLDEVGTRFWMVLAEHQTLESTMEILLEEYDVEKEQLEQDLTLLVEDLVQHGLLQVEPPLEIQ